MSEFCILILAFLQTTSAYHGIPARSRNYELPQNTHNEYINFETFDDVPRSQRQLSQFNNRRNPSSGFVWESESEPLRQSDFNSNLGIDSGQDSFIFEDDFENRNFIPLSTTQRIYAPSRRPRPRVTTQRIPTSTVAVPGMGTPRTPCENRCFTTPEYNPVCGDDDMTYFSRRRLTCAQKCGKRVQMKHLGACSLIPPRG